MLVEFGEMEFDLTLNFLVQAVDDALRRQPLQGLIETAPGFRSILVTFDSAALTESELVAHLGVTYDGLRAETEMTIPSPAHLPSRRVRRLAERGPPSSATSTRSARTPRTPRAATTSTTSSATTASATARSSTTPCVATEHWSAFIGFFPGLPFMFPLDPRHAVVAPKYNPTRTWTPEGAVGVGGPCWAIYPVESAGGLPAHRAHDPDLRPGRSATRRSARIRS